MNVVYTKGNITLFRNKERSKITLYFPDRPSDSMLEKLIVYAANLAMEEGMDIYDQTNIEVKHDE